MSCQRLNSFLKFCLLFTKLMPLSIAVLFQITSANAHELRPAIIDVGITEDAPDHLTIKLTFSGEAFLADVDLSAITNTDDSSNSERYDALRALPPSGLANQLSLSFMALTEKFIVKSAGRPLSLELVEINVLEEEDRDLARDTIFELKSNLPGKGKEITIHWQPMMGALLIRQMGTGSNLGYSDYLSNGGTSKAFLLSEIQPVDITSTIKKYVYSGIIHIVPGGLDHILFVVGLLAYGLSARGLILQISLFTVAHTLTLAAASLGWINLSGSVVEPLIALSIVWIGIENVIRKSGRLAVSRSVIVFTFGLLHGLGFASVLSDFGLPQNSFIISLLSFNVGVEIGQLLIVVPIFFIFKALKLTKTQFRRVFQIPVSLIISAVGTFWFIERISLL